MRRKHALRFRHVSEKQGASKEASQPATESACQLATFANCCCKPVLLLLLLVHACASAFCSYLKTLLERKEPQAVRPCVRTYVRSFIASLFVIQGKEERR